MSLARLACACLLAACAGKSERRVPPRCAEGRDLGPVDLELRQAFCERAVRCGLYADVVSCERVSSASLPFVRDGESGCVRFHPEKMEECIRRFREAGCTWTAFDVAYTEACLAPFEGTLDAGEPCASNAECRSGACIGAPCGEACCPRSCGARDEPPGASCDFSEDCVEGAFCDDEICAPLRRPGELCLQGGADTCEGLLWCIAGVCTLPPARGEPCTGSALFYSCNDGRDRCDGTTLKCVRVAAVGENCSEPELGCVGETSCQDGVCVALPELGEPCLDGSCLGDLLCDTNGRCVVPPIEPRQPPPDETVVCAP